jgi:glycosyltransferase involved in cell wall biosynthesis
MRSKISIAMATYNGQSHLKEQLESVAAQAVLPLEIVITDDGSHDATAEIVAAFAARAPFPVRFHANPERLGFAGNFLHAASLCEGDYVAFSDQDDVWSRDKLARVTAEFAASDCDLVVHAVAVVDASLKPSGLRFPAFGARTIVGPGGFDPWLLAPGMAMVAKRELFTSVDQRKRPDSKLHASDEPMIHDEWLYFIGTALGEVALLPDALVSYRQHGDNVLGPPQAASRHATMRMAKAAGQADYELLAERARSYAAFLRALPLSSEKYAMRRANSAAFYARVAEQLSLRASLYRPGSRLVQRAAVLARLIGRGAYRRSTPGAMSFRSLAKDSLRTIGVFPAG